MGKPWKHPNGSYYLRERIPADLVKVARGRKVSLVVNGELRSTTLGPEIKIGLYTKDRKVANERYREVAAQVTDLWSQLRQGAGSEGMRLTGIHVKALAGSYRREIIAAHEHDPGPPRHWELGMDVAEDAQTRQDHERLHGEAASRLLLRSGMEIDKESRKRLLEAMNRAFGEAAGVLYRRAKGDYSPDVGAQRYPAPLAAIHGKADQSGGPLTLSALFEMWKADHLANGRAPATVQAFRRNLDSFIAFLGHEDAESVRPRDVTSWADHLIHSEGKKPATAQNQLNAVKRILNVGKKKHLLTANPAAGVSVEVVEAVRTRSQGFTDEEAMAVLTAALRAPDTLGERWSEKNKRAVRWAPWLCAYSGARIGEILQLRKQDVEIEPRTGIPFLRITPEAGTVKGRAYRFVPLHAHLIEQGFLDMVKARPNGHLFVDVAPGADAVGPVRNTTRKVAAWVRNVAGITDERVQPNHAWRHRVKTVGRECHISTENLNILQGHKDGKVSTSYGDHTVRMLAEEVAKLPRYEVS